MVLLLTLSAQPFHPLPPPILSSPSPPLPPCSPKSPPWLILLSWQTLAASPHSDSQTCSCTHPYPLPTAPLIPTPLWLILAASQALAAATGRQESLIKKQYDESGDLGTVASAARATQRTMFQPQPLTIPGVLKSVMPSLAFPLSAHLYILQFVY